MGVRRMEVYPTVRCYYSVFYYSGRRRGLLVWLSMLSAGRQYEKTCPLILYCLRFALSLQQEDQKGLFDT